MAHAINGQELLLQNLNVNGDIWPLVSGGIWVQKALPVVAILTNAATGSEMDTWAVISNMDTNEKIGFGGDALIPRVAFENPEYSFTLPAYQTACGASSMALNTILDVGSVHGCACHVMEHELSAYYDITHGHGMAKHACMGGVITGPMELYPDDVEKIYEMCL